MGLSDKQWMKVRFVYDDGYVIQLQFAFRRSLRNGVPLHGKISFVWQAFWRREPLTFTTWCRQRRFDFSGLSPYENCHHGYGYFSFVRFLSVAWSYNYYTHNFSCGNILIHDWTCYTTAGHWSTQQAFLMYTNTFWLAVSLHLTSQMVFLGLCSDETTPECILYSCVTWQNALCTYSCVLNRMQWVLLSTQLDSLMYFDLHRINIWEPQCTQNVALTSK